MFIALAAPRLFVSSVGSEMHITLLMELGREIDMPGYKYLAPPER